VALLWMQLPRHISLHSMMKLSSICLLICRQQVTQQLKQTEPPHARALYQHLSKQP
jgi:hypothetical protein